MVRVSRRAAMGGAAKAALVPPAAFAVHQLRYLLAFGGDVGPQLRQSGHSYLHSLVPWIVLLVGLAVGAFLWALGRAFGGQSSSSRRTASFVALWLACSVSLVAIFAAQELLEGLLATGHPAGIVGIFGYGGWWAGPAAAAVGLVLAAVFHGARWVLCGVSECYRHPVSPSSREWAAARLSVAVVLPRLAPLADGRSGRGPPCCSAR